MYAEAGSGSGFEERTRGVGGNQIGTLIVTCSSCFCTGSGAASLSSEALQIVKRTKVNRIVAERIDSTLPEG